MPIIQFSHANGFPATCYQALFQELAPYTIQAVHNFGLGKYQPVKDWRPMTDELIEYIDANFTKPVIGIGHSLGGVVTLWAATLRPDLFQQIILLDPPFLGRKRRFFSGMLQALGLVEKFIPIAKKALQRKDTFSSREEAFKYWQQKAFFRNFDPISFQAYVDHGLKKMPDGSFQLVVPAKLEAKVFATNPTRLKFQKLQVPCHYVYATNGGVLEPHEVQEHQDRWKEMEFIAYPGGHMFPLEYPKATAQFIKKLIKPVSGYS